MDGRKMLTVRPCYGHLGGTLGNRLFDRLVEIGWFEADPQNARAYGITPKGKEELDKLGVDIYHKKIDKGGMKNEGMCCMRNADE